MSLYPIFKISERTTSSQGFFECARSIYQNEGFSFFFKGCFKYAAIGSVGLIASLLYSNYQKKEIKSDLSDRIQRVKIGNVRSNWLVLKRGIISQVKHVLERAMVKAAYIT